MNIERTQHIGHYGVTFTVMRFTVVPENRNALGNLCLLGAGNTANELRSHIRDLYEKMLARDLPCKMKLAISKPLNRQQADVFNTRADIISGLIGGALAAPISLVSRPIGGIVGATTTLTVKGIIRSYHAGDVVIGLDAQVSGGIGPQRSLSAMVRQFQGADTMSDYTQWTNLLLLLILAALVDRTIKLPALRKWLGLCLLVTGPALLFYATSWIREAHLESLPVVAFVIGIGLLSTQNLYCKAKTSHHLTTAPTMNLAPNFPEDPVMQQLLQLLHEEIGLPKHKTIRLQTSLNFDLGCDGSEAKQLMETLEQEFALDLGDYDTYRYFNPPVFDVFLKRRSKGHGDKVPLTIGMLYLAIKTHSWDTQTLENLS